MDKNTNLINSKQWNKNLWSPMADIREMTRLKIDRKSKLDEARKLDNILIERPVSSLSLASFSDHYQHREMLRIAEATKLKNEAKAIDAKIKEIRMKVRENMKKYA